MGESAEKCKQVGTSQSDLSIACGWSGQSRIGNYEAGRTPSLSDCRKIIADLNKFGCKCSLDDVFTPEKHAQSAKLFKKWVTSEVLPSIRKNGGYIAGQETDDPELIMVKVLPVAQNVIERKTLELQKAKEIIEIQAPKAEFVDRLFVASTGSKTFHPVAKLLNINERKFRVFLVENHIQYWIGGGYLPYQNHIDAGRFEVKAGMNQLNGHACNRVLFTPKCIECIAQLLAKTDQDGVAA